MACAGCGCWEGEWEEACDCRCHTRLYSGDRLEPIRRTFDADELGIDQEEDD